MKEGGSTIQVKFPYALMGGITLIVVGVIFIFFGEGSHEKDMGYFAIVSGMFLFGFSSVVKRDGDK